LKLQIYSGNEIAAINREGHWRKCSYEELVARDRTILDVFWLKDKSLTDLDNLPKPDECQRRSKTLPCGGVKAGHF